MSKNVSAGSIPQVSSGSPPVDIPEGFRWCHGCNSRLPKIWFRGSLCRTCKPKHTRARNLQAKFGITTAEYDALLKHQNGRCFICHNEPKKQPFAVDHDHRTGLIRGLLCMWCNHKLLGGAREKVSLLKRAIEYLEHPPAQALLGVRKAPERKKKMPESQ